MHFVAVHAGYIKALVLACGIEHGVVTRTLCAKTKVVAHQHISHTQTLQKHLVNEGLRLLLSQARIKGDNNNLIDAAARQLGQFVAQSGNAFGRQFGFMQQGREIVARVGLKGHHTTGNAPVRGFIFEQGQHGLMAPVDAVKVTNGQGASGRNARMFEAAKYLHGGSYGGCQLEIGRKNAEKTQRKHPSCRQVVFITAYIVT